ncbi:hypothetical protein BANRA_01605 [Klebsiella pneumoniae]|nr:hypothetical protein BANRA_01605 [Klebsiella pneumoniae]
MKLKSYENYPEKVFYVFKRYMRKGKIDNFIFLILSFAYQHQLVLGENNWQMAAIIRSS